jgi:hypothetical protein
MGIADTIISLIGIVYLILTIVYANIDDANRVQSRRVRWLLYGAALMPVYMGFNVVSIGLMRASPTEALAELDLPDVSLSAGLASFGLAVVVSIVCVFMVRSQRLRLFVRRLVPASASYNPDSMVHVTAVALSLTALSMFINLLVASGGLEGLADSIAETGIRPSETIFNTILLVLAAVLGVGFAIRRGRSAMLDRLGLRVPTSHDLGLGFLVGIGLIGVVFVIGLIWSQLVTEEQFAEQTAAAEQLTLAINTLPLILLVAITAAVGEEIFFRGALQPVFGIYLTAAFFALLHTQYTLTPASILIWVVAVGFGWLRQRYSTTAAIIAHFVYNLAILLLGSAAGG